MAEVEVGELDAREKALAGELRTLLLPKDPNDEKNVILEIRAGAGGDEASLFAQDLFRMYSRFAEKKGWKFEVLDIEPRRPIGGIKEAIAEHPRPGASMPLLKYESGVHRVQRVPKTEAGGRIHTSTATVAVLPEADEIDVKLDPKDLKIEAFGSSGPGRPERQPELHGHPRHPQAVRPGRLLPGREIPAPEQGEGPEGPALPAHGHRPERAAAEDRQGPPLPGRDGGAEREDPDLQFPPVPDHRPPAERELPQHGGRSWTGTSTRSWTISSARPRPRRSARRGGTPARPRTLEANTTLIDLFRDGVALLGDRPQAVLEAKVLLLRAAGLTEERYLAAPARPCPPKAEAFFRRLVARRLDGVPLSHLTGTKEFWSIPFEVTPSVLVPRPETEGLVEKVLELSTRESETILDVGTGSGCIAVALARELPRARIQAVDVSERALRVARRNAARQKARHIEFLRSDLFSAFRGTGARFDFIVSNPPYISRGEWEALPPDVRDFEPRRALARRRVRRRDDRAARPPGPDVPQAGRLPHLRDRRGAAGQGARPVQPALDRDRDGLGPGRQAPRHHGAAGLKQA